MCEQEPIKLYVVADAVNDAMVLSAALDTKFWAQLADGQRDLEEMRGIQVELGGNPEVVRLWQVEVVNPVDVTPDEIGLAKRARRKRGR